jgi:hypothetical protein
MRRITNLANAGVQTKTAQTLARHCRITLTMDRHSHTLREQEAEALGVLPDLATSSREVVRKTGTDDNPVLASCLAFSSGRTGTLLDSDGLPGETRLQCVDTEKTVVSACIPISGSVCTSGDGPGLQNQWGV